MHWSGHLAIAIAVRQCVHAVIERMETSERDELELVTHGAQLFLELGNRRIVQVLLPVEGRRAVVGQQLVGVLLLDGFGEHLGLFEVRVGRFAPEQVGIGRVGQAAVDGLVEPRTGFVETFHSASTGQERCIVGVHVRGNQAGRVGVGAGQQHRRHTHDVRRESRGNELLHSLLGGNQHLAAHVAALLGRCQLVFEMNAGGARIDHGLHQFVRIEHAAKPGLGVGDDGLHPVHRVVALGVVQLVLPNQGIVDAPHHVRHRIGRIQRLVRVHLTGQVGVGSHLPTGQVNGLETGLDLLHGLVAGQCAKRIHKRFGVQIAPKLFRTLAGQAVFDLDGTAQPDNIRSRVASFRPFPPRVGCPVGLNAFDFVFCSHRSPCCTIFENSKATDRRGGS